VICRIDSTVENEYAEFIRGGSAIAHRGFAMTMRITIAASVSAALLATTATPVSAGGFGGTHISGGFGFGSGYRGHRRGWKHRHRDRVDAGDVIAGVAIIGVIAAIASSSSKSKRDRRDDRANRNDSARAGQDIVSEDQAVNACANAAEQQGGETASVRDIVAVDRTKDGWDVEGTIEQRDSWRDKSADRRRFTCSVRFGDVNHVYIDTGTVASR
jgi:hypothetical protein